MNPQRQWQFAGSVPENYERYLIPALFKPWAEDLVEMAALRSGDRVLDIACGTGMVARVAARRLGGKGSVTGLDLSGPMLAVARAAPEGASVEWREGSAVKLPWADAAFDVAFCQQGLQFFLDRIAALHEMHRVLASSRRLALSVWGPIERSSGFTVLADALAQHIGPEAGALMTTGPFSLSNGSELRALIAEAGFQDISIHPAVKTIRFPSTDEFVLRYATGSALGTAITNANDNSRVALLAEIAAKLRSTVDDQGLGFPIESNMVLARA